MHVRVVPLNAAAGSTRLKFRDTHCVLDKAQARALLSPADDSEDSNKDKESASSSSARRAELLLLMCLLSSGGNGEEEFSLTHAGYRYDFRARSAAVGRKWIRTIQAIQAEAERVQQERVAIRTDILACGTLPASVHQRTFAPIVVPRTQEQLVDADKSSESDAEMDDDDDDDDHVRVNGARGGAVVPASKAAGDRPKFAHSSSWAVPSVHLAARTDSTNKDDSAALSTSRDGKPPQLAYGISFEDLTASTSMAYGSSPPVASMSYGMAGAPPTGPSVSYGSLPVPPPAAGASSAPLASVAYGGPPVAVSYGAPLMPTPSYLSAPSKINPSAYGAPPEVSPPYHAVVPFAYHGLGATTPGTHTHTHTNTNSEATAPRVGDAGDTTDASHVTDDDDEHDHNGGATSPLPMAYFNAASRMSTHFMSTNVNSISMTAYGDVATLIRREEMALSKKLHKTVEQPAPVAMLESGYTASEVGDEFMAAGESHTSESESENASGDSSMLRRQRLYGDYNNRFQNLLAKRSLVAADRGAGTANAQSLLLGLADDFLESAKRYGQVVIDEAFIDPAQRTLRSLHAGGNVYQVGNILLELAVDLTGRFEPSMAFEMAAKVCGHQFKATSALLGTNNPELAVPLMAVIDHRGLRLVAYSVLPVGEETLVYGQLRKDFIDRGGAELAAKLQTSLALLNIKRSYCAVGAGKRRVRVQAGHGLQAHRGTDGRYYVVELMDSFPSVAPRPNAPLGSEFVNLFRAEFVAVYPTPLSANAYKPAALGMPDEAENQREIDEATAMLEKVLVPACAKQLTELMVETGRAVRVNEFLHEFGINVRYLGAVLCQMTRTNPAHMMLLHEMVARACKVHFRSLVRHRAMALKTVTNEPFRAMASAFFDLIFSRSDASRVYWGGPVLERLKSKFSLSPQTWRDFPDDLRSYMLVDGDARLQLFDLLCSYTGCVFRPSARALLTSDAACAKCLPLFAFDSCAELQPRVRQLDFVAEARGFLYQVRGAEQESRGFFQSAQYYYSASVDSYKSALLRSPTNAALLRSLGEAVLKATRLRAAVLQGVRNLSMVTMDVESSSIQEARSYFSRAIKADSSDPLNFGIFAHFWEALHEYDKAEALYLRALQSDPNNIHILVRYGQFLSHTRELYEVAEAFFNRAKMLTQSARAE